MNNEILFYKNYEYIPTLKNMKNVQKCNSDNGRGVAQSVYWR